MRFREIFQLPVARIRDMLDLLLLIPAAKTTGLLIKLTRRGRTSVFPAREFPWTAELAANWQVMRRELERVLVDDAKIPRFRQVHELYTSVEPWKTYFLWGYGFRVDRNCAQCPETARLIEKVPEMTSAMFSILPPGTKIPPHVGIYNGVLRYHLGLFVPEPERCAITIAGRVIHWREGEDFVFDNLYEHDAKNEGERPRVVLFLDFVRPLPMGLAALNRWVVKRIAKTRTILESRQNLDAFYAQFDAPAAASTRMPR